MISVIGLGFVGLTTALGFSEKGIKVFGYDIDKEKVKSIAEKKLPFLEKGMQEVLERHIDKNFKLAVSLKEAANKSKVIILCVGTPSDDKGKADLKYIKSAVDEILQGYDKIDKKVIVIKSTIPPSTTEKEIIPYVESKGYKCGKDIFIANNPEFLREGHAWEDFINPDRIVIGTNDDDTKEVMTGLYKDFNVPVHFVSLNTGEFIKYLSNTFLATLISYSNEMSIIADKIGGIDIKSAFKIFHEDKRWFGNPCNMQSYAYPGCGFGGYCLPKDTLALIGKAEEYGCEAKILNGVIDVNNKIKPHWISKIEKEISQDKKICVLGLSFKPDSDDIRQTPALDIIKLLLQAGYKNITAYDPAATELFDKIYKLPLDYAKNIETAVVSADAVIITTGWSEFIQKKDLYKNKKVYDLRYIL